MFRFKQNTRRDHVVSLLPPISITKSTEPSMKQRIYSDSPPPMTYTGSFPAKVLRHLDKSTFYSTPTKGESLLARKAIHDEEAGEEDTTNENTSEQNPSSLVMAKESQVNNTKKKKAIQIKTNNMNVAVIFDGRREQGIRCFSAPGFREEEFREEESGKQVLETGNLTAPVTPRLDTPMNVNTIDRSGRSFRIETPTRAASPMGLDSPDLEKEIVLELRGDSIDMFSRVNSRPNSRIDTISRLEWQIKMSEQHQCACAAKPKIRSAIREVPCAQKKLVNTPKETTKFEMRAVGFSLTVYNRNKSDSSIRMKERRNELLKDGMIIKDKTIQIARVDGEDPKTLSLPIVIEKDDGHTGREDGDGPESEYTFTEETALLVDNNSKKNGHAVSEKRIEGMNDRVDNKSNEKTDIESSEERKRDENLESLVRKPENQEDNENRNKVSEPTCTMENVTDVTKVEKRKTPISHKKRVRKKTTIKGPKK